MKLVDVLKKKMLKENDERKVLTFKNPTTNKATGTMQLDIHEDASENLMLNIWVNHGSAGLHKEELSDFIKTLQNFENKL